MMHQNKVSVVEKERNNSSRYEFRRVSREVTRDLYDIPEDNRALFAYPQSNTGSTHHDSAPRVKNSRGGRYGGKQHDRIACGVLSFSHANRLCDEPSTCFDSDYFHQITFLFVKPDNQRMGVGKTLVTDALKKMSDHEPNRPIRVESALGAADFFQKLGFVRRGEPYETWCSGSRLFRCIVNMEHPAFSARQSDPP